MKTVDELINECRRRAGIKRVRKAFEKLKDKEARNETRCKENAP